MAGRRESRLIPEVMGGKPCIRGLRVTIATICGSRGRWADDSDSRRLPAGPLLQTAYQRDKHQKHTQISTSEALQSIFADPSTTAIRPYVEAALSSGAMEVDDRGRINFYATSTGTAGFRYEWGVPIEEQDAVKVVLSTDSGRRHEFPESLHRLGGAICAQCRRPIFDNGTLTSTTG